MSCISRWAALCAFIALLSCSKTARSDDAEPTRAEPKAAAEEVGGPRAVDTRVVVAPVDRVGALRVTDPLTVDDGSADGPADLEDSLAETQESGTLTVVSSTGKSEVIELGRSKLADTAEYTVTVAVPSDAAAGKSSKVELVVTPKAGWKLNQEYPTKLTVTPPDGVTVDKPTQKRQDAEKFSEKVGAFGVAFSSASSGKKKFTATLRFAVCTDSTCDPRTANLAWAVPVK